MQRTTKFIVLGALLACGFCQNSIKQKLGQVQAKNLAQQIDLDPLSFDDLDCGCDIGSGTLPPAGGAADLQVFNSGALVSQGTTTNQIPNTASLNTCEGQCCSCSAAEEASASTGTKTRHFAINGDIDIVESVTFSEVTNAEEQSIGESQKVQTCTSQNQNGGSGSAPGGCVSVCIGSDI